MEAVAKMKSIPMSARKMRMVASDMGYILNEYGLYKLNKDDSKGKKVRAKSEEDIFDYLGFDYISPENRK